MSPREVAKVAGVIKDLAKSVLILQGLCKPLMRQPGLAAHQVHEDRSHATCDTQALKSPKSVDHTYSLTPAKARPGQRSVFF